jgi:hypothetical protein
MAKLPASLPSRNTPRTPLFAPLMRSLIMGVSRNYSRITALVYANYLQK